MYVESHIGEAVMKSFAVNTLACLAITLGVLISSGERAIASDYYNPQVGEPHADFVLPRIDNRKPVWLSQYRGKKVLLIQFASW